MSLLRPSVRSLELARPSCLRAFSSSATCQQSGNALTDILNTMKTSTSTFPGRNTNGRATINPSQKPTTATSLARGELRKMQPTHLKYLAEAEHISKRQEFERQQTRPWRFGDVYAPHDLTGTEMAKWRPRPGAPDYDAFKALDLNPIKEYKNFSMMSEYMTEMGRIKHSSLTGLKPVQQRRIAKAIRRAIGLGLMPSVHHHPELLALRKAKMERAR